MKPTENAKHLSKFCKDVVRKDLRSDLQAFVEQSVFEQNQLLSLLGYRKEEFPNTFGIGWEAWVGDLNKDHWKQTFENLFGNYSWCKYFLQYDYLSAVLDCLRRCEHTIDQGFERKEDRAEKMRNLPTHWKDLDEKNRIEVERFIIEKMGEYKRGFPRTFSEGVSKLRNREIAVNIFTGQLRVSSYSHFFGRKELFPQDPFLPNSIKSYPREKMITLLCSIRDEIHLRAGRGKVSPWINDEHCSFRTLLETGERVAFIEKTPRIRVDGEWVSGPKGCGGQMNTTQRGDGTTTYSGELYGQYPPSRAWCDQELTNLGWELEGRNYSS